MRILKIIVALLLAGIGLAGCSLVDHDPGRPGDEQIQKLLEENASFTVFLRSDATEAQSRSVEAALRALPGSTGVVYVDHDAAYQRMKQAFSAEPSRMPQIDPEILPESFEVTMADIAAVQKARDDKSTLENLPGVQDVIFRCTTVQECRELASPRPTAPPS